MDVSSRSRVLAVIGDPIEHSLSPHMHNAAIAALGLEAVYVAFRVDAVSLPHVMRAFEALSIAGNVTVPHKVAVSSLLIRVTGIAKDVGAVNTFWPENGRLIGDNTDVQGVLDTVASLEADGPWLILGTGGAARAAVIAARERSVPVRIRSRQGARANDLAEWARLQGVSDAAADDGSIDFGVGINATPVGMGGDHQLPMIDLESRLRQNPALLLRTLADGETVFLNLDTTLYYGTDEIGTSMWRALLEENTVASALERLKPQFDVDEKTLANDLLEFANDMLSKDLLCVDGEGRKS